MSQSQGLDAVQVLKKCWPQWTATVELFARRRRGRHRVNPQEYRELYETILDACQLQAQAENGSQQGFFQDLGQLVRPWVSVQSLGWASPDLLTKVLVRGQQAQQQLSGRSHLAVSLRRVLPVLVILFGLIALVGLILPSLGGDRTLWFLSDDAESVFYMVRYHVRRTTFMQRLFAGGSLVTVLTIIVVMRSARKF